MKRQTACLSLLVALLLVIGGGSLVAQAQVQVFQGYLCTAACGTKGIDSAGNDLTIHPEEHAVACMKECAYTGMGIMMKTAGSNRYAFFRFDPDGANLAQQILLSTKRDNGVTIEVKGSLKSDVIVVTAIRETVGLSVSY